MFGGYKPRTIKTVTSSENARQLRWQEHFAELFNGEVIGSFAAGSTKPAWAICDHCHGFRPTPQQLEVSIQRLGTDKAVGNDLIPAEALKAGGSALAIKLFEIFHRVHSSEQWPVKWKGGRIVDVFKGKGFPLDCSNGRGLLVSDHVATALIDMIKNHVVDDVDKHIPDNQFGCRKGGGTEFPNHTACSLVDYCRIASLSCFALFLDLWRRRSTR